MKLHYDAELVEAVAFLEARRLEAGGQRLLARRYDCARAKLYDIADPDERTLAFYRFHEKWFREFGFEDRILDVLRQFPLIRQRAAILLLRKAVSKKDEGAELFVRPDAQNVVMALRAERFIGDPALDQFLRHEFCHIADMLDESFGYEPDLSLPDAPPTELTLLRDRYRVLWDITIDGRLKHEGEKGKRFEEFTHAFLGRGTEVFERLWIGPRPAHAELVALATIVRAEGRNEPGASCPLCRFPTFQWAGKDELTPAVEESVRQHFPNWTRERGCCSRCAELYAIKPLEQPATLFIGC